MIRKALCTLACGAAYREQWEARCAANWRAYAARHGYDIIVVDQPIREGDQLAERPIHWQKLFLPQHPEARNYDYLAYLDADILINVQRAPCIVASMEGSEKVGAVRFDDYVDDDFNYYKTFIRSLKFEQYAERAAQRQAGPGAYALNGPDFRAEYGQYPGLLEAPMINSGVLVMQPARHAAMLEQVYHDSWAEMPAHSETRCAQKGNYDQLYVTWKLWRAGMIHLLDPRFNRIAYYEQAMHYPFTLAIPDPNLWRICFTTMLCNCFFLHFAGNMHLMRFAQWTLEGDFAILGCEDVFRGDPEIIRNRRHS